MRLLARFPVRSALLAAFVWLGGASFTPEPFGAAVLAQQPPGQPVQIQPQKGYLLEAFLVVALFSGAVYAVCRSSRRS